MAPNAIPQGFCDGKQVADKVLAQLVQDNVLDKDDYRLGNTKVFFKAGVLGTLEDWRDERLTKIISLLQAHIRGFLLRRDYQKLIDQRQALAMIQRNMRKWLQTKDWEWAKLFKKIRPQLKSVNMEEEMRKKQEAYESTKKACDEATATYKKLEEENTVLLQTKNDLFAELAATADTLTETEEKVQLLSNFLPFLPGQ